MASRGRKGAVFDLRKKIENDVPVSLWHFCFVVFFSPVSLSLLLFLSLSLCLMGVSTHCVPKDDLELLVLRSSCLSLPSAGTLGLFFFFFLWHWGYIQSFVGVR